MLAVSRRSLIGARLHAEDAANLIRDALKYEGEKITSIIFDPAEQPLPTKQMLDRLPFAAGSVFHEHDLRQRYRVCMPPDVLPIWRSMRMKLAMALPCAL